MPSINIDTATYGQLRLASKLSGIAEGDLIARLIERYVNEEEEVPTRPAPPPADGRVPVFKVFMRERFEGLFDPRTGGLEITSGRLDGRVFRTPTGAAVAVVETVNPERDNPQTNGWKFWRLKSNGQPLKTIQP